MADDLRTRIAAVIHAQFESQEEPCPGCEHLADAVIAELTDWELIDRLIEAAGPRAFAENDQRNPLIAGRCGRCLHWHLSPHGCGTPITQDIRVGNGTYDPVGRFYRSIVVDTCHCTDWKADDETD